MSGAARTIADLPPDVLERLGRTRFDRIVEKHEGPWRWSTWLEPFDNEFMEIDGESVLLPIGVEHHPNLSVLRVIRGADGDAMTVFLKDTTFVDDPAREWWDAGFVAVVERFEDRDFHVATLYHEWFILSEMPG